MRAELVDITSTRLAKSRLGARAELEQLQQDELQHPITYNHYFTDNIQNSRQEAMKKLIRKAMDETKEDDWGGKLHVSNISVDADRLLASLQKRIIVDMEAQACTEALAGLQAYYKVRKPFQV